MKWRRRQLGSSDVESVQRAVLAAIGPEGFNSTFHDIADRSGVPVRSLRRRHRTEHRLLDEVVDGVLVDVRRSLFRGSTPRSSIELTVHRVVTERIRAYLLAVPVIPAVLHDSAGLAEFNTLRHTLRAASEYELSKHLGELDVTRRSEVLDAIEASLALTWIDCLQRGQGRSVRDTTTLLVDQVMSVIVRSHHIRAIPWSSSTAVVGS